MVSNDSKSTLLLATRNSHKADEFRLLLASDSLKILDLSAFPNAPMVDETASSLKGNATLKALSAQAHTGLWSLSDDTGLFIDALHGQPGVHSARFAGKSADSKANRSLVLDLMANTSNREAKFMTILALALSDEIHYFEGHLMGRIARSPMSTQGFGYESIFIPDGFNISLAELSKQDKNQISHRGKSAVLLKQFIDQLLKQ